MMSQKLLDDLHTESDLCRNEGASDTANLLDEAIAAINYLRAQLAEAKMPWIDASVERPKFIRGEDYSENVFGVYKGYQDKPILSIFQLIYVDADEAGSGWAWAKMSDKYGNLREAECDYDDDYEVTHWMPMMKLPAAIKGE